MARLAAIKTSFNAGELSPKMTARVDTAQYVAGAETLLGVLLTPFGGADRTPGTRFVGEVKDSTKIARLIPFSFSTVQTYMLELNGGFIRFYKDGGRVLEANKVITGATQASPVVITSAGHGFANGDEVLISGVGGMTQLNGLYFIVAAAAANTFALTNRAGANIDGTGYGAYTAGGTAARIYQIAHPWADADLFAVAFAQSADVMYLAHPLYAPRKLSRTGHTSWTLTAPAFTNGPYLPVNATATTLTAAAVTGNGIVVTASATTGINGGDGFKATDVGRLLWITDGTTPGWGVISTFTDTTHVKVDIKSNFPDVAAHATWQLGAWSDTTGYPSAVTFFEQRLAFAGSTTQPQTIWLSVSQQLENMTAGTADSAALLYTIATLEVNKVQWLAPVKVLVAGTSGGPFSLSSGANDVPLTPTNVVVKAENTYGSAAILPKIVGNFILYVQRDTKVVRELAWDWVTNSYLATDVSLLSEHLLSVGVVEMAYQQFPYNIVWAVLADGGLATFTREVTQQVKGWSHQITDGLFESVGAIPVSGYDQVWFVVNRTIGGAARRYVEVLAPPTFSAPKYAFFVHSGLTYDGAAVSAVSGLDHLEGKTVVVIADGAAHPNCVVTGGAITLARSASVVTAGLLYTPRIKTLRIEGGSAIGTAQGLVKKVHKVIPRLVATIGLWVGSPTQQDEVLFRSGSAPMDQPVPAFTGDKYVPYPGGYDHEGQVVIEQREPFAMYVAGLTLICDVFEGV